LTSITSTKQDLLGSFKWLLNEDQANATGSLGMAPTSAFFLAMRLRFGLRWGIGQKILSTQTSLVLHMMKIPMKLEKWMQRMCTQCQKGHL
jgi:hypothetical protein